MELPWHSETPVDFPHGVLGHWLLPGPVPSALWATGLHLSGEGSCLWWISTNKQNIWVGRNWGEVIVFSY